MLRSPAVTRVNQQTDREREKKQTNPETPVHLNAICQPRVSCPGGVGDKDDVISASSQPTAARVSPSRDIGVKCPEWRQSGR